MAFCGDIRPIADLRESGKAAVVVRATSGLMEMWPPLLRR